MRATIRGRVRNTKLPKTKPLVPLFEAVINAFQSIDEAGGRDHRIDIAVERERDLLPLDKRNAIVGFTVTDTGVGFTDANYKSFDEIDSPYKETRGGKGLGRFHWLVAFDRVEIVSDFRDSAGKHLRRSFAFLPSSDSIEPEGGDLSDSDSQTDRTIVHLQGYREPYRTECPRQLESIAYQLVSHFLRLFLDPNGPAIWLSDGIDDISLRQFYQENFGARASQYSFKVAEHEFIARGFFRRGLTSDKHELIYAADSREVAKEKLSGAFATLPDRLQDKDGNRFIYTAFVEGQFLNEQVTSDRSGFAFPDESENADEITKVAIRDAALSVLKKDLEPFLSEINQAKRDAVRRFVAIQAPHYRWVANHVDEFIDDIPSMPSPAEMETLLHREQYRREIRLRDESQRILAETVDDPKIYYEQLRKFTEDYNEMGMAALAQHVVHRRVILNLVERAIAQSPTNEKFPYEKVIHNLVFPMKYTSDDLPPDRQNLWIVDERLMYHSFLASDMRLTDMQTLKTSSLNRPDIAIFDHPMAFTDGSKPLSSIVIIEFKRPDRDDYDELPVEQVYRLLDDIRGGDFRDHRGIIIQPANTEIPAYCYVICDLTPKFRKGMETIGATRTPDNRGYFGYNGAKTAYYEVISYEKLLDDAKKRNRALFDKLGIPLI